MMEKIYLGRKVQYNGATESWRSCSSPKVLDRETVYEVEGVEEYPYFTYLKLKGVPGKFNSCWFEIVPTKKTYLAFSKEVPEIGEQMKLVRLQEEDNNLFTYKTRTTKVQSVKTIEPGVYDVHTRNSIYIVKVI